MGHPRRRGRKKHMHFFKKTKRLCQIFPCNVQLTPSMGGSLPRSAPTTAPTQPEKKDPTAASKLPKPKPSASKSGHHRSTSEKTGDAPDPRQSQPNSAHENLFDQLKSTPSHRSEIIRYCTYHTFPNISFQTYIATLAPVERLLKYSCCAWPINSRTSRP